MRIAFVIAFSVAALVASAPAHAADLAIGHFAPGGYWPARAGMVVIYDDQPGVVMRRYWLPPWRDRHYFPTHADLRNAPQTEKTCDCGPPKPAESYERSWSTSSNFMSDAPNVRSQQNDRGPPVAQPAPAQP